jgi:hypothetical protein
MNLLQCTHIIKTKRIPEQTLAYKQITWIEIVGGQKEGEKAYNDEDDDDVNT